MSISVETDIQIVVSGLVSVNVDAGHRIVHAVQNHADSALVVQQPLAFSADIAVVVQHWLDAMKDARQTVFGSLDRTVTTKQRVVHPLALGPDVRQTVFAVLINESHEVQT